MRLSRIGLGVALAQMGMMAVGYNDIHRGSDWDFLAWSQSPKNKSKPNKISQAKRRKYARQGRK